VAQCLIDRESRPWATACFAEISTVDIHFELNGRAVIVGVERAANGWSVRLPGGALYELVGDNEADGAALRVRAAGAGGALGPETVLAVPFVRADNGITMSWLGNVYHSKQASPESAPAQPGESGGAVAAPTGGVIADVLVVEGQTVEEFQPIAVIEAMKVMTPVESPRAGKVGALLVARGERVERGAIVAHILTGDSPPETGPHIADAQ
jgi:biotin carboxyl carrier protein